MALTTILPPQAEMQAAYLTSDSTYDGVFFLGVRTTGIFCRPTCPARKPRPENVEYFTTAEAALAAGYRPCKRCRPLQLDDEPQWASSLIKAIEATPSQRITDGQLRTRGIDPATVRRYFQRRYGMTFQAFHRARRLAGVLNEIRAGARLDHVAFESGYHSASGFRDAFTRLFGSSPGKAHSTSGIVLSWLRSPLGPLVAGATDEGICLLEFTDRSKLDVQLSTLRKHYGGPLVPGTNEHLKRLEHELADYFAGTLRNFTVPIVDRGTPFQRAVWQKLLEIPYGETRSYQQLARDLGQPTAVRAVGRANGQNRIAIVIPCHRVVNKNGQLAGYAGGLRRKQFLLNLEGQHVLNGKLIGRLHPAASRGATTA